MLFYILVNYGIIPMKLVTYRGGLCNEGTVFQKMEESGFRIQRNVMAEGKGDRETSSFNQDRMYRRDYAGGGFCSFDRDYLKNDKKRHETVRFQGVKDSGI